MKVFLSWSGRKSEAAAQAFRKWIPNVLQNVDPWLSVEDISAGARWTSEVQAQLAETRFGIVFITSTNCNAPWLLFEVGALAKTLVNTFVCPYLLDIKPTDIPAGPLTQFQAKEASKRGTLDLLETLNMASGAESKALPPERLTAAFTKWWPDLSHDLDGLPSERMTNIQPPSVQLMLEETLDAVREMKRNFPAAVDQLRGEIQQATLSPRTQTPSPSTVMSRPAVLVENRSPKEELFRRIRLIEIQLRHLGSQSDLNRAVLEAELANLKKRLE